jgi:hypothetical protein
MFENKQPQKLICQHQPNHPQDIQQSNSRDYCNGERAGAAQYRHESEQDGLISDIGGKQSKSQFDRRPIAGRSRSTKTDTAAAISAAAPIAKPHKERIELYG